VTTSASPDLRISDDSDLGEHPLGARSLSAEGQVADGCESLVGPRARRGVVPACAGMLGPVEQCARHPRRCPHPLVRLECQGEPFVGLVGAAERVREEREIALRRPEVPPARPEVAFRVGG
jgi:hypothetical protein